MNGCSPQYADQPQPLEHDRVYLVPYRWWREAQLSRSKEDEDGNAAASDLARGIPYTASPASSSYGGPMRIINNIFNSDLVFNLRCDDDAREGDYGEVPSARCYALVPTDMWSQALRWHRDSNSAKPSCSADNGMVDDYPILLRTSVIRETKIMTIKISKKDNASEYFKKACKIFPVDSESIRICDFSGQTDLIFMNEWNRLPRDFQHQPDEILLELQVYALSEFLSAKAETKKDDLAAQQQRSASSPCNSLLGRNGSIGTVDSEARTNLTSKGVGSLGLTGLENLGNTCFMNSAIQCLAHTPKLVEYFLGDYSTEINHHNPLGMDGELASAFGELLRKLWALDRTPVAPHQFKLKLAHFAPQFSGFNQHDSQELLAFLLDGLHEDLNRVKCKPYAEAKDACGRLDEEVADEYWANHLARNDSVIVDLCQGQYRSTLVCPVCNNMSVTFDPFMYLSLPLPSTTMRTMTVTVFGTDGSTGPASYTINVPKYGKCKDLIQALSISCSLRDDESLLVGEVYANCIIRYLDDPSDSLSLIRDGDLLAAYRLSKDLDNLPLVVFINQRLDEHYVSGKMSSHWKAFGVPLISRLSCSASGSAIHLLFLKLLNPFLQSKNASLNGDQDYGRNISFDEADKNGVCSPAFGQSIADADEGRMHVEDELQYYRTDGKGQQMHSKIEIDEPVSLIDLQKHLYVLVRWQDKALRKYDLCLLNTMPEVFKSGGNFAKKHKEAVSLYACLEAFIKEEPLGPEDMWYCPSCKKHQQASKKLDLWRLPEVMVIHLKRFSYSRFMKNKLETYVDFPIRHLDLSVYIANKTKHPSNHYSLYAVSNHYGNMGGGHYTAYVHREGENCWYDFDDRHVVPIDEGSIKTSAAYVLFYRRVQSCSTDSRIPETNSLDTEVTL